LAVTGSIANSTISLSAYTQLGGTGTVGTTTAGSSSVLAPGVAIGAISTLSIAGDLTFATGSYAADIGPGSADKLQVSGVTTIAPNSGLSIVSDAAATYAPGVYTLLNSAGNLSGQFSYVNYYGSFSSGIVPFISYDAHDVFLTLSQEKTWLSSPGTNLFASTGNWASGAAPGSGETAVFGNSSITTVAINGPTTIGAMRFTGGVPRYTFDVAGAGGLTINNRGITDPFFSAPAFNVANGSSLTFTGFATSAGALIDVALGGVLFYSGGADPGTSRIDGPDGVLDIGGINRTTFGISRLGTIGTIDLGGKTLLVTGGVTVAANIVDNSLSNGSHPSAVRISGGGVRFTGTGAYTGGTIIDSNGTLRLGNNGTTGSIVGNVADDGLLSFERSDTITYGGVISGAGRVLQSGSGTTILGATNTYTGVTTVSGGRLLVDGAIASSAVTVASGAILGGAGNVGATTVQGGGTLAPGDGIGTLQINGNLNLASGANYAEDLSSMAADQIIVNGNASIAGNFTANLSGGGFSHQTYTILHSIGTVSGAFASISFTGLTPGSIAGVSYSAHDVYLTITPMDAASADFGGDGKSDILWQKADGPVLIWQMNASGTVGSSTSLGVVNPAVWSLSGIGDYNGDGKADVLLRNADGTVANWLMNGAAIAGSNTLGTMDSSWSLKGSDDFNDDGIDDILWEKSDGTVVIWRMNASGGIASIFNLNTFGSSIAGVGDFNGDGQSDILLRGTAGEVKVWLINGGAVAATRLLSTMNKFWSVKGSGDFNGDGRDDLLWQKTDGTVVIWQMNAAGLIASSTTLGVVDPAVWSLSVGGDYNGDGKADILLRNANGSVYNWLMNGAAIAGSSFLNNMSSSDVAVPPPVTVPPPPVSNTNDFNGDSKADMLWHKADGTVVIWQTNAGGSVAVSTDLTVVDPTVSSLQGVGDYNGDGKADILLHNADDSVTIWLMNGAAIASTANLTSMSSVTSVKGSGDFNGDGRADILWDNSSSSAATIWLMNASGGIGTSLSVSTVGVSIAGVGDYNGDGTADILLRKLDGTVGDWLMSNGQLSGSNNLGQMDSSWSVIGSGDFNGDGISDILWQKSDGTVVIWQMNDANTVASKTNLGIVNPVIWSLSAVADYNGDGKADILLRNANGSVYNWLMNGPSIAGSNSLGAMSSSALSTPSLVTVPAPHLIVRKDFDNDGHADILWHKSDGTVLLWRMNGAGAIGSTASLHAVDPAVSTLSTLGDYNGDGFADVLLRNADTTVQDWLGPNAGNFQVLGLGQTMDSSWSRIGSGDFGADGADDILWQKSDGTVLIWTMLKSSGLTGGAVSGITNLGVVNPAAWSLSAVADYNGDGKADVLLRNANGGVYDWLMNGPGIAGSNFLGIMDNTWSIIGTGDFGGDGKADILWQKSDGTVVIWQMNSSGGVASTTNLGVVNPAAWSLLDVGDYNGDGKADVLLRSAAGSVADWLMNGAAIMGSNSLGTMNNSWTAITR
jgi:autotransporter-associated beta strand protein